MVARGNELSIRALAILHYLQLNAVRFTIFHTSTLTSHTRWEVCWIAVLATSLRSVLLASSVFCEILKFVEFVPMLDDASVYPGGHPQWGVRTLCGAGGGF